MSEHRISGRGQIGVYLGKCFRLFVTEKQWKNFVSTFIIVVLVCLVTSDEMFRNYADTKNGAFAIISGCIWIGLFNSIQSICRERAIIKREHRTGLRLSSYILAHVIYELFLSAVEALIVLGVVLIRNHTHLPPKGLVFPLAVDLYLTLLLVTFSADMIAILISSIVRTENTAMTVMPFVLIIQLVMSGAVFALKGVTKAVSYLTISRWGLNAVCAVANTDMVVEAAYRYSGGENAAPTASTLWGVWGMLLAFAIIYILLSILFLRLVDRDQR